MAVVDGGHLTLVEVAATEKALYSKAGEVLGAGEAEAIAIAANRGVPLATDDRKARRVALDIAPELTIVSTPTVVRRWASKEPQPSAGELAAALRAIERRASFVPPRDDANRDWWMEAVKRA